MIIRKKYNHEPHKQIGNICGLFREYRLPAGMVNMPVEDTPAVVVIILYFLDNDTNRTITKLQYQFHLLDNMCLFEGTDDHILDWSKDKKNGVPNIEPFLKHMESINLIKREKGKHIPIQKGIVTKGNFHEKLQKWVISISEKLRGCNASETRQKVTAWVAERMMS